MNEQDSVVEFVVLGRPRGAQNEPWLLSEPVETFGSREEARDRLDTLESALGSQQSEYRIAKRRVSEWKLMATRGYHNSGQSRA